jgi:hypothetical protein
MALVSSNRRQEDYHVLEGREENREVVISVTLEAYYIGTVYPITLLFVLFFIPFLM